METETWIEGTAAGTMGQPCVYYIRSVVAAHSFSPLKLAH